MKLIVLSPEKTLLDAEVSVNENATFLYSRCRLSLETDGGQVVTLLECAYPDCLKFRIAGESLYPALLEGVALDCREVFRKDKVGGLRGALARPAKSVLADVCDRVRQRRQHEVVALVESRLPDRRDCPPEE